MMNTSLRLDAHGALDLHPHQRQRATGVGQPVFSDTLNASVATTRQTATVAAAPLMSVAPQTVALAAPKAEPKAEPKAADTPLPLQGDAAVVQALKDALTAAGVNTSSLGLEAHQDVVTYPGGSYVNHYIAVNTHGHVEGLMTNLVAMNPNVAVLDIKHMLAQG